MMIFGVIVAVFIAILLRRQLGDLLVGLGDAAVIGWGSIWSVLRWVLVGGLILWLVSIFAIVKIGDYANAGTAIWIFWLSLPAFLIALARSAVVQRPVAMLVSSVSGFAVLISGGFLLFGLFAPEVKKSSNHFLAAGQAKVAANLDEKALQSVAEAVMVRPIKEETRGYGNSGKSVQVLGKGEKVKLLDPKNPISINNSDPMVLCMTTDSEGNFVNGNRIYVLVSKIELNEE